MSKRKTIDPIRYLQGQFYRTNDANALADILFEISKLVIPNYHIRGGINYDLVRSKHKFITDLASVMSKHRDLAILPRFNTNKLTERCPGIWEVLKQKYKIILNTTTHIPFIAHIIDSKTAKRLIEHLTSVKKGCASARLVGECLGYPKKDIDAYYDREFRKKLLDGDIDY